MNKKNSIKFVILGYLYKIVEFVETSKINKECLGLCGYVKRVVPSQYYSFIMYLLMTQLPWYRKLYIKQSLSVYWWYDKYTSSKMKKDCWYDVRIKHVKKVIKRIETSKIELYG